MNIEKIFNALEEDDMNSGIGIICSELERQGYKVKIEDIVVTAEDIFEGKAGYLEEFSDALNIEISSEIKEKQKFKIRFINFHYCVFEK